MFAGGFGVRRENRFEPPVEMRFVDLFMIIVVALMFITVMLSVVSAFVGGARVDVAPRVATASLPSALLNRAYSVTLAVVGGTSPYTWLIEGELPKGLALDASQGIISGIPVTLGNTLLSARVADGQKRADSKQFGLEIRATGEQIEPTPVRVRVEAPTLMLGDAVGDAAYEFRFAASGGTPPYQWALAAGSLPPGLQLTRQGEVIGSPQKWGESWEFAVLASDAVGEPVTQNARLFVKEPSVPLWQQILSWGEVAVRIVGYVLVAIVAYMLLFAPEKDPEVVHQRAGLIRRMFGRR